jgi:thioredoxin-like negative regulator of GroEL
MSRCTGNDGLKSKLLQKAVQVLPDHTEATLSLAKVYATQNRKEEACRLLQRVLEIPRYEQQYDTGRSLYEKTNCGRLLISRNK